MLWIISFAFPPNSELTKVINTCQSVLTLSHGKEIYATECLPIIRLLYVNVKYHEFVWILEKSWIGKKKKSLEKAHGDLTRVNTRGVDAVRSGSCQRCPGPGQGALEAPPGSQEQFCARSAAAPAQAVPRGAGGPPGELQHLLDMGWAPAGGGPAGGPWARGTQRCLQPQPRGGSGKMLFHLKRGFWGP